MTDQLGVRTAAVPGQRRPGRGPGPRPRRTTGGETVGLLALTAALFVLLVGRGRLENLLWTPMFATWATVFVSIVVQALPFLVLGVVLSSALTAFVPAAALRRALPRNERLAVPVAGAAGAVLPGCECASVPVAAGLMRRGVPQAAALAFLLAAPAINPIVLVATAVAFPDHPEMVAARFLAALGTAVVVGWLWLRFGGGRLHLRPGPGEGASSGRLEAFRATAEHDFLHAGGFLVLGGITAATLNVLVPAHALDALGGNEVTAIASLALLAVVLAVCSEADAFVAASLTAFPMSARLTFLVVGPVVDVKLIALHVGTFGRRFALWFVPVTLAVAITTSVLVGKVLL